MVKRFLLYTVLILLAALGAAAQSGRPSLNPPEPKTRDKFPPDQDQGANLPEEVRVKMAIERADSEYKKVLEDVEKLSGLSAEIAKDYREHKQLSADDVRKLSTIEKLSKRVLNHVGGEEVGDKPGATEHITLADAIDRLNTTAENIKKDMKAETRFVVSASVIANSNEVINLARFIRHTQKAD